MSRERARENDGGREGDRFRVLSAPGQTEVAFQQHARLPFQSVELPCNTIVQYSVLALVFRMISRVSLDLRG